MFDIFTATSRVFNPAVGLQIEHEYRFATREDRDRFVTGVIALGGTIAAQGSLLCCSVEGAMADVRAEVNGKL